MAVANVGIADYKIIKSPDQIMTVGLGSCCGVVIYDEINKIPLDKYPYRVYNRDVLQSSLSHERR